MGSFFASWVLAPFSARVLVCVILSHKVLIITGPLTVGSVFRGIKKEIIISVTVTAKVTEEGRKPRKHIRQTAWQKRMKSFEKYVQHLYEVLEYKLNHFQMEPNNAKKSQKNLQIAVDVLVDCDIGVS